MKIKPSPIIKTIWDFNVICYTNMLIIAIIIQDSTKYKNESEIHINTINNNEQEKRKCMAKDRKKPCTRNKTLKRQVRDLVILSLCWTVMEWSNVKQAGAQNFGPIDPGQIQRELRETQPIPQTPTPPQKNKPESKPLQNIEFQFKNLEISGATNLKDTVTQIQDEFNNNFSNTKIDLKKIYEIRDNIQQIYADNGYALTQVILPPQDISAGEIRLEIIEGFIENYKIIKGSLGQQQRVRGFIENIIGQKPAKIDNIQRNLLLMNDLAGYQISATLKPGTTKGGSILILSIDQKRAGGFFEVNNWANKTIGPVRLQSGVILNSLGDQGEKITISGAATLFDFEELRNTRLDFNIPIGNDGLSLYASGSYTETRPGDILRPLKIQGEAFNFNIGLKYAIIRSRKTNLNVQGGFDLTNNSVSLNIVEPPAYLYVDRTRNLQLGINFNHQHDWGLIDLGILFNQGITGLGARNQGTPNIPLSTEFGHTDAFRTNLNFNQFWQLPKNFSVQINKTAQISNKPLLIGDQFSLGGPNFGSAYNPSQTVGDSGYAARMEIQKLFRYGSSITPLATQPYLFFDYGQTFNQKPTINQNTTQDLASAGFGIRQFISSITHFRLEIGFPLVKFINIEPGSPQIRFSLQSIF